MNNENKIAGENEQDKSLNLQTTAQTAAADEIGGATTNDFGKFKDLKGLLNAYNALQSEFTRRCQRVKELERENTQIKEKISNENSLYSGSEWEEKAFLETFPDAVSYLKSLKDIATISGDNSKGRIGRAYLKKLQSDYDMNNDYYKSYEYVKNALESYPELKSEIIKNYLLEVESSKPTVKLMTGNAQATVSPASRPKNLAEAGEIAKQLFEKHKENINLW